MSTYPIAIHAAHAPPRVKASSYPVEFATRLAGRDKRPLGDRSEGDEAHYPDDDLKAVLVEGQWRFAHRDGRPYPPRDGSRS
ncbi:MAG: hypothetical protein IPO66_23610 [Rhodanobacteraceae bacterium]|nr:hypothetical protein [Rhodanobacteraceae bacterium]